MKYFKSGREVKNLEPKIVERKIYEIFGVLYLKQKTLDEIFKESGPLAKHNEFQVHYTSLIGTYENQDGESLYINIPLVFYNYKQTVSGAHIDFDLKDVEAMHMKTLPLAQDIADEIVEKLRDFPIELKWSIVGFNSIHRHPGSYNQGFSGTDLDTDVTNPGIVYPLNKPKEPTPNFASIMYVSDDTAKLSSCSQIRVAYTEKDKTVYLKGRSYTFIEGYVIEPTEMEKLFGINSEVIDDEEVKDGLDAPLFLNHLKEALKDYEPEVFVDSKNLSEVKTTYKRDLFEFSTKSQYSLYEREYDEIFEEENDLWETDDDFRYIWSPTKMDKATKQEYLNGIIDEIILSAEEREGKKYTKKMFEYMGEGNIIALAKKLNVLAPKLKPWKG